MNDEEPAGTLRSLESVLRNVEGRVAQSARLAEQARRDLVTARSEIGKPFKQLEDLKAKRAELAEVEKKLEGKKEEPETTVREQLREAVREITAERQRAGEGGFIRLGGEGPTPGRYEGFEDEEIEQRWRQARGVRPEPLISRVREALDHLKNIASR